MRENALVLRPFLEERAIFVKRAVNIALKEQLNFHNNNPNKKRTPESSSKKAASEYFLIEVADLKPATSIKKDSLTHIFFWKYC